MPPPDDIALAVLALLVSMMFIASGLGLRHRLGFAPWFMVRRWWPGRSNAIMFAYAVAAAGTVWCFAAGASPRGGRGPAPWVLASLGWIMHALTAIIVAAGSAQGQPTAELRARIPIAGDHSADAARRRLRLILTGETGGWRLLEERHDGHDATVEWYGQPAPAMGAPVTAEHALAQRLLRGVPRRALVVRLEESGPELRITCWLKLLDIVLGNLETTARWVAREQAELARALEVLGWEVEAPGPEGR